MRQPLLLTGILLLISGLLVGQTQNASLSGLVLDPAGAMIAGATVRISQPQTGLQREAQTGENGLYNFESVPIGVYEISVEHTGFRRAVQKLTLETSQRARADFTLAVGELAETVTVESSAPQLSPNDASLSAVVDNTIISQVPQYLRSWDDLALTLPGIQGYRYTEQAGTVNQNKQGRFAVHGVRMTQNNWVLDGVDNNTISTNTIEDATQVVRPSLDSIQEFRVITNPYNAEYGRSGGAAIVVSTKGGTNRIRGAVYEYVRNRVFDANDFFANRSGNKKLQNNHNQFGVSVGGPVVKNKVFWYFDWEGTRLRRGLVRTSTVPLPNERIGDFSPSTAARLGLPAYPTIYDPLTGEPFADNRIPRERIDPNAARIIDLFPAPNFGGGTTNNFVRTPSIQDDSNRFNFRGDWQPTSNASVFGRYSYTPRDRFIPGFFGGIADGTSTGGWGNRQLVGHGAALGWTQTISPRLVNELRIGFSRNYSYVRQEPFGQNKASDFVPGIPSDPFFDGGLPNTRFVTAGTFIGSANFAPNVQITQQWQFLDTVSLIINKHTMRFGADVRAPMRNIWQDVPATRGEITFDRIFTCGRGANNQCLANTGNSWADGLLGYVQGAQLSNKFVVDQRLHMYSFFFQDDWKVTQRLTVNMGLRYDFASTPWDAKDRMANFNPEGQGSLYFAKDGSLEDRTLTGQDRNNWAPRLGIAYQLRPGTVIRAGGGIFYSLFVPNGSEDQMALNPPNFINNVLSQPSTATEPVFLLRNGFPANFLDPSQLDLRRVRIRAVDPHHHNPMVSQWSFGIQQQLPARLFLEANYVGTKSTHLRYGINLNQLVNGVRPYPNFGSQITWYENGLNANYHGLDLSVERRFAAGLAFRGSYTWSKNIDQNAEALTNNNSGLQGGRFRSNWRGPSDVDFTHRFVATWVYELPFGKGKPFAQNGVIAAIAGNWQLSGSFTAHTGRPFTVVASANNASLDATAFPNVIGTPQYPKDVDCWFYQSNGAGCRAISPQGQNAFANPPLGTFGNSARNSLRGPGLRMLDLGVYRVFPITETTQLQFRWETFNLTNTAQFGNPQSDINNGSVGAITTLTADPRVMQFALRLRF
ncbi:MAG TPA: TonB-dependent receptor [Bryobacteraceae bacterium]|nr:TonB-dependent receptor [Bryobacteraceae bacterium]